MAEIILDGLDFSYPDSSEATLVDVSLQVAAGEAHALLGGSGAGKSTLLNLLSGLLPVTPGCIFFDGRDVSALDPWQRGVSQVFQFPVFYEGMTVEGNLSFPLRGLNRRRQRARVCEIAERLGILELLPRRPRQLTLVQKQLAAIGKSLVREDVSLVLLDEPLTAAEPEYKWQLRQALQGLRGDLGATMIYVTHDQAEALTFAERVSVLHEGRLLQTGTPRELVESPRHAHVGYFVGSPGMNFIDPGMGNAGGALAGEAVDVATGDWQVGFRPEWARVVAAAERRTGDLIELPVEVRATRTLNVDGGGASGLVIADLEGTEVVTRQRLDGLTEGPALLEVDRSRLLWFRDGWQVAPGVG